MLTDGTPVVLRLVRPSDLSLLSSGFERLSPESRYHRFFGVKKALSPSELKFFTDCDGINHFALGAVLRGPDGKEHGLGVVRFVRVSAEPTAADAAVTVVDAMQRKGLGSLLVARLLAAAAERGIDELRFDVLASNRPMLAILRKLESRIGRRLNGHVDGGVVELSLRVPPRAA